MTDTLVKRFNAEHNIIKDLQIDDLPVETWKLDIKHLSELREPMLVLFSKCEKVNDYGKCIREEFITVAFYDNACCDTIQEEIIQNADWFYILDNYPIDQQRNNLLLQKFSYLPWRNKLKHPVQT